MGAFFYSAPGKGMPDGLLPVFRKQGFGEPYQFSPGGGKLWYFSKQLTGQPSFLTLEGLTVATCGTCIYRGRALRGCLAALAEDCLEGRLDRDQFRGNFIALFMDGKGISFHADRIGQYRFYYDSGTGFCSSSFLAMAEAVSMRTGKLHLNRPAVIETLLTGNLVGTGTLLGNIRRYYPWAECRLPGIEPFFSRRKGEEPVAPEEHRGDMVELQIRRLREHFECYEDLFRLTGASAGLTGGFDSRLLYLVAREHARDLRLYFNTSDPGSGECRTVRGFAEAAGTGVALLRARTPLEMDTGEYGEMIRKGFHLWDGACSLHHLWLEERKSGDHIRTALQGMGTGLSGVGGEKFRNHDALVSGSYSAGNWLKHEVLFYNSGNVFRSPRESGAFIKGFREKVMGLLGEDPGALRVPVEAVRRYYDVLYNTSNRTLRHCIENRMAFSLCPFAEPDVSVSGFRRTGRHVEFQMALVSRLAPDLRFAPFIHGFGPGQTPALRTRLMPWMKTDLLLPFFHMARHRLTPMNSGCCREMVTRHRFLAEYLDRVRDLQLPLELDLLAENPVLGPIVVELGMFLSEMESCIATC